jgi:hypothetical protein
MNNMLKGWKNKKRALLMAGGVFLFCALIYWALPSLRNFQDIDTTIAVKEKQLRKYRQKVAEGEHLAKNIDSLEKVLAEVESGLLIAETPSLAAVDIQEKLHAIAKASGADITSLRVLDPKKLEYKDYLGVPVQFTVNADIRGLKEILYRLENSAKYFKVGDMRITVRRSSRTKRLGYFRASITVMGYMQKPA